MSAPKDADLLAAAVQVFDREGWGQVTIEKIADEARVPTAEVIRTYPSREHLAVGMFAQVLARLPDEFADEVRADQPLTDKLYFLLAHEIRSLESRKSFTRRVLGELFNPFSPMALMQMPLVERYTAFTADLIRQSRSRGEISRFTLPWAAAWGFWLLRGQVIAYWLTDNSEGSERTHAQATTWVDLFVRSLESVTGPASGLLSRLNDAGRRRRQTGTDLAAAGIPATGRATVPAAPKAAGHG